MLDMHEVADRVERRLLRSRRGTKRKIPEPRTGPPLSSLRMMSPRAREERAERFQAYISTVRDNIRKLEEAFAQDDDMEQED